MVCAFASVPQTPKYNTQQISFPFKGLKLTAEANFILQTQEQETAQARASSARRSRFPFHPRDLFTGNVEGSSLHEENVLRKHCKEISCRQSCAQLL